MAAQLYPSVPPKEVVDDLASTGSTVQVADIKDWGGSNDLTAAQFSADYIPATLMNDAQTKADIAAAFQEAVAETMVIKCRRALQQTGLNRLVVAGGVAANQVLRHTLKTKLSADIHYPCPEFCTDNAAMIAYVGYQRLIRGEKDDLTIRAVARWPLDALSS